MRASQKIQPILDQGLQFRSFNHLFVTIWLIQFHCLVDDAILRGSCQSMTSRTNKLSTGNSHAAYMRGHRKRRRLEEDNCNNVPKRTKLNAKQQCEYGETHKNLSAEL
jgi:hypothetical protein